MEERVILVNEQDEEIGEEEKIEAHKKGLLHRAFSLFLFNSKKEMLLQRRALTKYHCGGLWTNACCSHPRKGETLEEAVRRRIVEEFGFSCPDIRYLFSFIYRAELDHGMIEHEYDHVFVGQYDKEEITPNPDEIMDFRYVSLDQLNREILEHPESYTPWFKLKWEAVGRSCLDS